MLKLLKIIYLILVLNLHFYYFLFLIKKDDCNNLNSIYWEAISDEDGYQSSTYFSQTTYYSDSDSSSDNF